MSYVKKIEYEIILKDSLSVIRSCPKCNRKTLFINTKKFRVNANGNKLDIWLIYQCSECNHSLNLAIYERRKVSSIPKEEYQGFLDNDKQLAEMYGKNMQLFQKNKVTVDFELLNYDFIKINEIVESDIFEGKVLLTIHNPYMLKIRPEKQISEILGLSRNQIKDLIIQGKIYLDTSIPQIISVTIDSYLLHADK